jgi:integrase
MSKRHRGDGGIDERGPDSYRLRYRIRNQRYSVTFKGTLKDARKELRRLLRSGDTGEHVDPSRLTTRQWVEQWIAAGAPGRRQARVSARSLQRYEIALRCHVAPVLGTRPLQQLSAPEIDSFYMRLSEQASPATARFIHDVLNACLQTAVRKGLLAISPMTRVLKIPTRGEVSHGVALDADQLRVVVAGFQGRVLYPIVATAAFTGARRNEVLALRWNDLDVAAKTLRIERSIDEVSGRPRATKAPKTGGRGKRTIVIDDDLQRLLCAEREKHLRIKAGVPDGVAVDLGLVKLPDDALMFPNPPAPGEDFSFTQLRNPNTVTKHFMQHARALGFAGLRFHDLRGAHETALLDAGVPVRVVADRCGHDVVTLLKSYAKRTRKADTSAAAVIGMLAKGVLEA